MLWQLKDLGYNIVQINKNKKILSRTELIQTPWHSQKLWVLQQNSKKEQEQRRKKQASTNANATVAFGVCHNTNQEATKLWLRANATR